MKADDSDAIRHKVPLSVKRNVQQVSAVGRVQAKYSAESDGELPEFHPNFDNPTDDPRREKPLSMGPSRDEDVADIHGLDSDDMSPEIADVMDTMMAEITRLRAQLDVALNRISFLEGHEDHDPVAGCLTAPAFVRNVAKVLLLDQKGGTTSSLAMMTIKDWEAIHHGMNRKADETVISHLGRVLREEVRTGDVVGHTADDEFAIIFVASDVEEANDLATGIRTNLENHPPTWASGTIEIETIWKILSLANFDNADDVMARADLEMRLTLKTESGV